MIRERNLDLTNAWLKQNRGLVFVVAGGQLKSPARRRPRRKPLSTPKKALKWA
jgi:hypothetical protein